MSKEEDEANAAKAVRPQRRLISQAPAPIEPIQGRANVVPRPKAESDRPSVEAQRKILETHADFDQAAYECQQAIEKGRSVNRVNQKHWAYESRRWTEVLRPAVEYALTKYRDFGMPADALAEVLRRVETLDREWKLVCDYREDVVSTHDENDRSKALFEGKRSTVKGPKTLGVTDAINHIWSNKIPKGLSAKERNRLIIEWLKNKGCSVPKSPERAIQRVLKTLSN